MTLRPAAGLLLLLAGCTACAQKDSGPLCFGAYLPNIIVVVRAADGTVVCDAIVELLDARGVIVRRIEPSLMAAIHDGDAQCGHMDIQTGTFGARARRGASVSETQQIDVAADECNYPAKPVARITLTLMP